MMLAQAQLDAVQAAVAPVLDWYQSDEQPPRPLAEIVADVVADLQADRTELLGLRSWHDARLGHGEPGQRVLLRCEYRFPDRTTTVYYDAGYWTEFNGGGWVWHVGGRVTHWRAIVAHPDDARATKVE